MTRQALRQLVHHGEAWCEKTYDLGLDFCEVFRGTLLEEGSRFLFPGSFSQWRQALSQLGGAVHTRGKRVTERLRAVSFLHACPPIPKGEGH
jgi:hypothetical protein